MQMLDVGSTSGWLVPTYMMKQKGIDPETHFGSYAEGASAAAAQMATTSGQVDLATGWDTHRNIMIRNGTIKEQFQPGGLGIGSAAERGASRYARVSTRRRAKKLQAAFDGDHGGSDRREASAIPIRVSFAATHEPYLVLETMGYAARRAEEG